MKRLTPAVNAIRSFKTKHFTAILVLGIFAVISSCGGGGSGTSVSLSPPTNVKVARGSAKDTVSWTAATGAAKYKVYAVKSASSARSEAPNGVSANDNSDCACSWQSMTCTSDVASGSTCNFCETTNTCADFDHAPADTGEYYQVTGVDQAGKESAKSDKATDSTGTTTPSTPSTPSALPPGMSLSCVGVEHRAGFSYIHLCVNLTNVPRTNCYDYFASMGSTPGGSYSCTYSSNLDDASLTKICTTFTVYQYGSYSGVAGVTTNGGSVALTWDINVTSATVACS